MNIPGFIWLWLSVAGRVEESGEGSGKEGYDGPQIAMVIRQPIVKTLSVQLTIR